MASSSVASNANIIFHPVVQSSSLVTANNGKAISIPLNLHADNRVQSLQGLFEDYSEDATGTNFQKKHMFVFAKSPERDAKKDSFTQSAGVDERMRLLKKLEQGKRDAGTLSPSLINLN